MVKISHVEFWLPVQVMLRPAWMVATMMPPVAVTVPGRPSVRLPAPVKGSSVSAYRVGARRGIGIEEIDPGRSAHRDVSHEGERVAVEGVERVRQQRRPCGECRGSNDRAGACQRGSIANGVGSARQASVHDHDPAIDLDRAACRELTRFVDGERAES